MCELKIRQITPTDWIVEVLAEVFQASVKVLDKLVSDSSHPLKEWVAGDDHLLLHIPSGSSADRIRAWLENENVETLTDSKTHEIPVSFNGPDLGATAAYFGLSEDAYVSKVCAQNLFVKFMGFSPGFGYMTGLPEAQIPRRENPRKKMQVGAVAVAAGYASIYPIASPGGWNWIANSDVALIGNTDERFLLQPGDSVRFTAC